MNDSRPFPVPDALTAVASARLQFHNVLIPVLLVSAGVTALLAHWVDTNTSNLFGE